MYLTWTDPEADLDLYLTAASCNDYPPENCTILAASVRETGTSEEVTFTARAGERYRVWVDNWSFEPQSYELTLTNNQGVLATGDDTGLELSHGGRPGGGKPAGARKIR
jgi:hypothetical protein